MLLTPLVGLIIGVLKLIIHHVYKVAAIISPATHRGGNCVSETEDKESAIGKKLRPIVHNRDQQTNNCAVISQRQDGYPVAMLVGGKGKG